MTAPHRKDINVLVSGMRLFPYVQYADATDPPGEGRRSGWWNLVGTAQATGVMSPLDDRLHASDEEHKINAGLARAPSIDILRTMRPQAAIFPHEDRAVLYTHRSQQEDRRIYCISQCIRHGGLIERGHTIFAERADEPDGTLRLVSLRASYMQTSWLANTKKFGHCRQRTNPLNICEADPSS